MRFEPAKKGTKRPAAPRRTRDDRIDRKGDFARTRVYRRREKTGFVYSVVFKNREKWRGPGEGFFPALRAIFIIVPLLFIALAGCVYLGVIVLGFLARPDQPAPPLLLFALVSPVLLWFVTRRMGLPRRTLRIELDQGRGELRVMRGRRIRKRLPPDVHALTIEEHPDAAKDRIDRQIHGTKRPTWTERQHCLVGWFGFQGGRPEILACRVEWPNRNSLMEVQRAIYFAAEQAQADLEAQEQARASPLTADDPDQPPRQPLLPPRK